MVCWTACWLPGFAGFPAERPSLWVTSRCLHGAEVLAQACLRRHGWSHNVPLWPNAGSAGTGLEGSDQGAPQWPGESCSRFCLFAALPAFKASSFHKARAAVSTQPPPSILVCTVAWSVSPSMLDALTAARQFTAGFLTQQQATIQQVWLLLCCEGTRRCTELGSASAAVFGSCLACRYHMPCWHPQWSRRDTVVGCSVHSSL